MTGLLPLEPAFGPSFDKFRLFQPALILDHNKIGFNLSNAERNSNTCERIEV